MYSKYLTSKAKCDVCDKIGINFICVISDNYSSNNECFCEHCWSNFVSPNKEDFTDLLKEANKKINNQGITCRNCTYRIQLDEFIASQTTDAKEKRTINLCLLSNERLHMIDSKPVWCIKHLVELKLKGS